MKNTKMLKKNYEFRKVLSRGNHYSGKNLEIFIQENNKNNNFLGLAISSKQANAVNRNRIKRLIRENYKNFEDNIKFGKNIIFLLKKDVNIKDVNFYSIYEDMNLIFDKANLKK